MFTRVCVRHVSRRVTARPSISETPRFLPSKDTAQTTKPSHSKRPISIHPTPLLGVSTQTCNRSDHITNARRPMQNPKALHTTPTKIREYSSLKGSGPGRQPCLAQSFVICRHMLGSCRIMRDDLDGMLLECTQDGIGVLSITDNRSRHHNFQLKTTADGGQ